MILNVAKNLFIIRRMDFFVVEVTIFMMPLLVAAKQNGTWPAVGLAEGTVLFFILFSLGDIVNCLADRDLDKIYKSRLSNAVYALGEHVVRRIVVGLTIVSILLAAHLAWTKDSLAVLLLVALG